MTKNREPGSMDRLLTRRRDRTRAAQAARLGLGPPAPTGRRPAIAAMIKAMPEASNRQVARVLRVSDHTVASVRAEVGAAPPPAPPKPPARIPAGPRSRPAGPRDWIRGVIRPYYG